ncbi:MAG: protease-4 [Myxococcota bacterium]|jgi:protease-4
MRAMLTHSRLTHSRLTHSRLTHSRLTHSRLTRPLLHLLVVSCLALMCVAGPAYAQTAGLLLPAPSTAEPDGVDSLHHNPAGLTTLPSWELRLHNTQFDGSEGQGTSVLLGTPVIAGVSVGLGVDFLRPQDTPANQRLTLGMGYRLNKYVRFGMTYRHFFADDSGPLDGTNTMDFGVLLRPVGWLSLGATVQDLVTPRIGGVVMPRRYQFGLGFQPGTDRVTIEADLDLREDDGALAVGGMLRFEPIEGLELRGWGRYGMTESQEGAVSVGGSLALHFGFVGASGGVVVGGQDGVSDTLGWTVSARVSGAAYGPIFKRTGKTIVVSLGGVPEEQRVQLLSKGATWTHMMSYLDRIRQDPSIGGVLLRSRGFGGGWAQLEELRDVIGELQAAGKVVTVYMDQGDLRHAYAYATADRIILNPAGGMMITGLKAVISYYKTALDRLQIDIQWVKYGKYKSYPEAFSRTGPSQAARDVRNNLLDTLYDALAAGIASGREKTPEQVKALIDAGPYVAKECLAAGLVDKLLFWDEVKTWMAKEHGAGPFVSSLGPRSAPEAWGTPPAIAVVVIEGSIVDGNSSRNPLLGSKNVGGNTIVKAVQQAAANPNVAGILLRINSPGGSSVASDHMHRALFKAAKGKPIVASMGNVAASGGYYAAMGATEVFANDLTVTGSIGIFTGKPAFGRVLTWLGINRETFSRGANANLFGTDKPWTERELKVMQQKLKVFYDLFLSRVAENRKMTVEKVHESAQGRVWFGSQALTRKLTDTRGGTLAALRRVKELAGLGRDDRVALHFYPKPSLIQKVRNTLGIRMLLERMVGVKDALRVAYPFLDGFAPGEPLALMPFDLQWETGR